MASRPVNGNDPDPEEPELDVDVTEQSWGLYAWQVELLPCAAAEPGAIKAILAAKVAMRFMNPFRSTEAWLVPLVPRRNSA
jgi:hypothetical protein